MTRVIASRASAQLRKSPTHWAGTRYDARFVAGLSGISGRTRKPAGCLCTAPPSRRGRRADQAMPRYLMIGKAGEVKHPVARQCFAAFLDVTALTAIAAS